jgi:tetratricopeptide (TPR) repeat protein
MAMAVVIGFFAIPALAMSRKEAEETFRQANALFRQASDLSQKDPGAARDLFVQSAMHFERLAGEGGIRSGELYYNIGNTYFRMGDLGRAILNYRRAQLLLPGDPDLLSNLEYARSRRADKIPEPEPQLLLKTIFFWHYDVPLAWKRAIFLGSWVLFWLCASVFLFSRRPSLRWGMIATGVVASLWLGSLLVDQVALLGARSGVILFTEVIARKGDGETYQPSFQEPLHAGTEFSFMEGRPGWWQVRLSDGRVCWLPEGAAALTRPEAR